MWFYGLDGPLCLLLDICAKRALAMQKATIILAGSWQYDMYLLDISEETEWELIPVARGNVTFRTSKDPVTVPANH